MLLGTSKRLSWPLAVTRSRTGRLHSSTRVSRYPEGALSCTYCARSEGHLSGCDTARLCLTAWLAAANGRARTQAGWEGSHRPRRKGTFCASPVELESCGQWLAGRRIPRSVSPSYYMLPGTYVDWLRAAATRVPLDRFVYARRKKRWWPSGSGWLLYSARGPRRLGLGEQRAYLPRGVSGPATVHPRRLLSASTANNTADVR